MVSQRKTWSCFGNLLPVRPRTWRFSFISACQPWFWTPWRLSAAAFSSPLVCRDCSGLFCLHGRVDNQPLTARFHSADVFISAALFQSRLLNLKTLFTITSNYSACLRWGIEPCPCCFLRLPAPARRLQRDVLADRCSSDGAVASPTPTADLINAGSAAADILEERKATQIGLDEGSEEGGGCYCN